jgi:hypothetical protein
MRVVVNFVLFQVAWFACVLGGAYMLPWVGPLAVAGVVAWHLWTSEQRTAEAKLLLAAAVTGAVFDSLLVAAGWLVYPSGQVHALLAPYWIVAMWVAFATTFNVSLNWLKGRDLLGAAFGAVGGPLAYYAGAKLGGVSFADFGVGMIALAIGWGVMMPLLMRLADRLQRDTSDGEERDLAPVAE